MSRNHYYKLRDAGRAPRETEVDGVIMILPEDEAAWQRMMTNPSGTEQQSIEEAKAKRHRRSLKAGAASAASAKHISKQGRRRKK